jgi:hypothetical protein
MRTRRGLMILLGGAAAGWPLPAWSQQKLARIGFLRQAGPHEKQFNAFREGLRAGGYIEGRNIVIEEPARARPPPFPSFLRWPWIRSLMGSR